YRRLENYKYLFGLAAIVLLYLPRVPGLGTSVNGAQLWVHVGALQFQPGELAKIALIVFLAGYLREKREVLAQGRPKDFGPLLVIWGAAMGVLVITNDLGSALLLYGIFIGMVYVATARLKYVLVGLVLFVGGGAASPLHGLRSARLPDGAHRRRRVLEAARHRLELYLRLPDVPHRGRGRARDPADRHHPPLCELRRLERRRELRAARRAAPRLQ